MAENDAIVETLTKLVEELAATIFSDQFSHEDARATTRLYTRSVSAIRRFAPPDSIYRQQLHEMSVAGERRAADLGAVVEALRDDYRDGDLRSAAESSTRRCSTTSSRWRAS